MSTAPTELLQQIAADPSWADSLSEMADGSERAIDFAAIARDLLALRAFANAIMEFWPGDFDGGDLQNIAEKHGLLKRVLMKGPCREEGCGCTEYLDAEDWPSDCYRHTSLLTGNPETDVRIAALEAEQAKATP